jgi:hypothetical protein
VPGIQHPLAHRQQFCTPAGVFTHIAQRLLATAAGIWHNWNTGVTSKRSLNAFDH